MIHFASPVRSGDAETEEMAHNSGQTDETQQSANRLETQLLKNPGSSKLTKYMLMSDKTTLRLNDTEQSIVSRKQRQYTTTPNRFHSKVMIEASQPNYEEVQGELNFDSTLRRNTLVRRNMVDEGTSPIDSDMKNMKGLARRHTTNIDVVHVYQPDEPMIIYNIEPEKVYQIDRRK